MKVDVLVAGAGPVGLAMAVEVARYGLSVRIVDKAAERTDKSKALVLWSRTLELLDRAGCSQGLIDAGGKVLGVNIVEGSTQIAHLVLDRVATPHPYALMLPQSETERLLDEHLNANGIQVERGVELTKFAASADQVVCTLRHADGREEQLEASWLIGCDGAHSTVRHQLGLEFIGDTLPSNWILADVHLSGLPWQGEIDIVWHADGVLAIFPSRKTAIESSPMSAMPLLAPIRLCRKSRRFLISVVPEKSRLRLRSGLRASASTSARSQTTVRAECFWPEMRLISTARQAVRE